MNDLFLALVRSPSRETYLAVRQAVLSSPQYQPYSNELHGLAAATDSVQVEQARRRIAQAMPNLLLSPQAHLMLAHLAGKAGDEKVRNMEGYIAAACVRGILATGAGSRASPYLVLRTSDEQDVLMFLQKQFASQSLHQADGRAFDVLACKDGSELWFDITDALGTIEPPGIEA